MLLPLKSLLPSGVKAVRHTLLQRMQSVSCSSVENKYQVRKLEISDKGKGFLELLRQLTVCDSVSDQDFQKRFEELKSHGDDRVVCVIEDDTSNKIIATGSVLIERKFIRSCGKAGHIEDIVVDSDKRGLQLGKKIVEFLTDHARSVGCYKVVLYCGARNIGFYEKCGLEQKATMMGKYFT